MSRISCPVLAAKVVAAEEAVAHIHDGDNVGFSGFTGAGYPKAVPAALAATMIQARDEGRQFQIGLWTGASTAPDADGVLAAAHGISTRLPYNSDPTLRRMINAGDVRYIDAHLSHSAQHMWFGFYGKSRRGGRGGDRGTAGRAAGAQLLGGQQQDLARPGRAGNPRGQPLAAAGAGGLP